MRPALHAGLVVTLLISFSRAPYDHYHPEDTGHHHTHKAQASGAAQATPPGPVFDEGDHDATARWKDWLAGDGSTAEKHAVETATIRLAAPQAPVAERVRTLIPRNHDPPGAKPGSARAPPRTSCL